MIKLVLITLGVISLLILLAFIYLYTKYLREDLKSDYSKCVGCFYLCRDTNGNPYCLKNVGNLCKNNNYQYKKEV